MRSVEIHGRLVKIFEFGDLSSAQLERVRNLEIPVPLKVLYEKMSSSENILERQSIFYAFITNCDFNFLSGELLCFTIECGRILTDLSGKEIYILGAYVTDYWDWFSSVVEKIYMERKNTICLLSD